MIAGLKIVKCKSVLYNIHTRLVKHFFRAPPVPTIIVVFKKLLTS